MKKGQKKIKALSEGHPIQTVPRTVYWKAVRDMVVLMGGKKYSFTYIRECANGIKEASEEKMAEIRAAMDRVPLIPVNIINHKE